MYQVPNSSQWQPNWLKRSCCCCGWGLQSGAAAVAYVNILEAAVAIVLAFKLYTNPIYALLHAAGSFLSVIFGITLLIGAHERLRAPVLLWLVFGVAALFSILCVGGYWLYLRLLLHGEDFVFMDFGIIMMGVHFILGSYFWVKVYQYQEELREDQISLKLQQDMIQFYQHDQLSRGYSTLQITSSLKKPKPKPMLPASTGASAPIPEPISIPRIIEEEEAHESPSEDYDDDTSIKSSPKM